MVQQARDPGANALTLCSTDGYTLMIAGPVTADDLTVKGDVVRLVGSAAACWK